MREVGLVNFVGDCARCVGLCCVALPFARSSAFARAESSVLKARRAASMRATTGAGVGAVEVELAAERGVEVP